jgi:hypothetical protein
MVNCLSCQNMTLDLRDISHLTSMAFLRVRCLMPVWLGDDVMMENSPTWLHGYLYGWGFSHSHVQKCM